jgi:cephalosporin-C deacetylase-like acetyl esterase
MTTNAKPADFDAYWSGIDEELARYDPAPELELSELRSTDFATMYFVRLTSIGPYRIFAYLSVPHGDGPFPTLLNTPRYGSVNNPPHYDDKQRYVTMTLMHRGQRLADKPYAAAYPGLLTDGIEDPAAYIYRGILADCFRGAEYLLSRPEVQGQPAGIVGDDLAIITAARRPGFSALNINGLMFYRMLEAAKRTSAYPLEEINEHIAYYQGSEPKVANTVSYFDPLHHAPDVRAATLFNEGDPGSLTGAEFIEPLYNALGGPVERYLQTHEGGTDHDANDAWMASQLGCTPRPRLWAEAMV